MRTLGNMAFVLQEFRHESVSSFCCSNLSFLPGCVPAQIAGQAAYLDVSAPTSVSFVPGHAQDTGLAFAGWSSFVETIDADRDRPQVRATIVKGVVIDVVHNERWFGRINYLMHSEKLPNAPGFVSACRYCDPCVAILAIGTR